MIKEYLSKKWAYYQRTDQTDLNFEDWVNSLSNLELIEYMEAALKETATIKSLLLVRKRRF